MACSFMEESGMNRISPEAALSAAVCGMRMYDAPIMGIASADDSLFEGLRQEGVVGPHFRLPKQWLPQAKSVSSLFFPMTKEVRRENAASMDWPSHSWVHSRGEGMDMIDQVNEKLRQWLERLEFQALSPVRQAEYFSREDVKADIYTSNWSERHVAYICGLGTFGLSKGLITKRGVAGRFTSIVTDRVFPPDARDYTAVYEYCSFCGACARNCPVEAISLETGKDHVKCSAFVNETIAAHRQEGEPPRRNRRYGCGKCQVRVPCEEKACKKK